MLNFWAVLTSLVVLYSQNYATAIHEQYHKYFRLFWINPPKSLLKLSHPKKYLVNFLPKKSLNWKFRTPQKSFDHPCPLTIWSTSLGVLVKARKVLLFFPYNFHQNELIHLHSKSIHQVFHTNCKRSGSTQAGYGKLFVRLEPIK